MLAFFFSLFWGTVAGAILVTIAALALIWILLSVGYSNKTCREVQLGGDFVCFAELVDATCVDGGTKIYVFKKNCRDALLQVFVNNKLYYEERIYGPREAKQSDFKKIIEIGREQRFHHASALASLKINPYKDKICVSLNNERRVANCL